MAGVGPAAIDREANTVRVLVGKNEPNQQEGTAAMQRSGRMFLTLSFSVLGIAVVYFGTLYLIAH
jgi:hypothetical protein